METIDTVKVTEQTLLGFNNCFSLCDENGNSYRVVNFYLETLEHLIKHGLTWPIKVSKLDEKSRAVVVNDERIPDRFYRSGFCETCCPERLLPVQQKLIHGRQEARGDRKITKGDKFSIITTRPTDKEQYPDFPDFD